MQKTFRLPKMGFEVEIGKYARQADGSVWLKCGDNVVLSTVVASKELNDVEILTCRMIDRPIRPLFPSHYFNEVQLLPTVLSADGKFSLNVLAIIASSLALSISKIPFLGPIGAVQVGRINGEWKFNLGKAEVGDSDAHIIIAGTKDGICMVEGSCNKVPEKELIDLLFKAHEQIKEQVDWQLEIQKELGVKKEEVKTEFDWDLWEKKVKDFFPTDFAQVLFVEKKSDRNVVMDKLRSDLLDNFSKEIEAGDISKPILLFIFDSLLKQVLPDLVAKKGVRVDGRKLDKVRPLEMETSVLPCTHGSATFRRGETQALTSLVLGTAQDAQRVEPLIGEEVSRYFMLHYNFPPFSTGEVKMIRGVGRREIGHGYLAENSFNYVLPDREKFPYTVRSVVDILESNGSSSMASVCATTLALMDAGVPIKDMIGGIAMGLMKDSSGKAHILTDILGIEDAFGLMDFKVTGTQDGIMAIQMDIKDKAGLTKDMLNSALEQARIARLHILDEMKKVLGAPRKELSALAPRLHSLKIPQEKIGAIIGPAGRTIKEIISQTNAEIDIEDDGTVMIYAKDSNALKKATAWINVLAGEIEVGSVFPGVVRRITDFGIFVELVPGKDGLVHISNIAREKQRIIEKICKLGEPLEVKVVNYDKETGRVGLVAPELKKSGN